MATRFSEEALGADWQDDGFGWRTSDRDNPGARWRFDLEQIPTGTRLRYRYVMGPGWSGTSAAIESKPDKHARIVNRRLAAVQSNMQRTIEGITRLAGQPTTSAEAANG